MLSGGIRIWLAFEPVDMRLSFDGLAGRVANDRPSRRTRHASTVRRCSRLQPARGGALWRRSERQELDAYAAISPAPPLPTNGSSAIAPARSCCN